VPGGQNRNGSIGEQYTYTGAKPIAQNTVEKNVDYDRRKLKSSVKNTARKLMTVHDRKAFCSSLVWVKSSVFG